MVSYTPLYLYFGSREYAEHEAHIHYIPMVDLVPANWEQLTKAWPRRELRIIHEPDYVLSREDWRVVDRIDEQNRLNGWREAL